MFAEKSDFSVEYNYYGRKVLWLVINQSFVSFVSILENRIVFIMHFISRMSLQYGYVHIK